MLRVGYGLDDLAHAASTVAGIMGLPTSVLCRQANGGCR